MKQVAVLDYGSGNVHSVSRALAATGAQVTLTSDVRVCLEADGLVVPGVGAFAACIQALLAVGGEEIISTRLAAGKPILGICVGHQVLFDAGIEHGVRATGLGLFPGTVERLQADVLPHMGWNTVEAAEGSQLFSGIQGERFYFVHSYAARVPLTAKAKVSWTNYGGDRFISAVEQESLFSTQFHPEKSGAAGAKLLSNWVATF